MKAENQNNDFAAATAAAEQAQAHAQEIQQTRVGGLGGSDADILRRVGVSGLSALNATDTKRLCVMLGKIEPDGWQGNAYTDAGHLFEDYAEKVIPWGEVGCEREKVLTADLALSFKTFAHADFSTTTEEGLTIVECKYTQYTTMATATKYAAQLQWYYILGAKKVYLYHGWGKVDPFEVEDCDLVPIDRDESIIRDIIAGVRLLDEAIESGWQPLTPDKVALADAPAVVQKAFATLERIKNNEEAAAKEKEEAQEIIKTYIEEFGLTGIYGGDLSDRQIVYTRPTIQVSFNSTKFLQDHPEFATAPEYQKRTKRKSSVTLK